MPSSTRRRTLDRRRTNTLNRLSESQRRFFMNIGVVKKEGSVANAEDGEQHGNDHQNGDNCNSALPDPFESKVNLEAIQEDILSSPSNDNEHSLDTTPQIGSNGEPASDVGREALFRKHTISMSDLSDQFVENMHHVADHPPVRELNNLRKLAGKFVNDDRVQAFILALIVINAIMMGVATYPFVKENPSVSSKFDIIDQIFLIIFTIEAAMQLIYHGWTLFKDSFLVFDLTIVALSWALDGVKVARAFRIFRALRLITRIDVMRNLITALISVIPNLTAIIMLLCLVFFIFGVMFTNLYKDASKQYPRTQQYFVALPETLFTLFQMMTLDGWKKVYTQAYEEYWWSWMLFITFIVVTAFIFANLIIAVICDAVHVLGKADIADLLGYDEIEGIEERGMADNPSLDLSPKSNPSRIHKLKDMNMQVDHIVIVTNYLSEVLKSLGDNSGNGVYDEDDAVADDDFVENTHGAHTTEKELNLQSEEIPRLVYPDADPDRCSFYSELSPSSLNDAENRFSIQNPQCQKQGDERRVHMQPSMSSRVVGQIHECVDNPRIRPLNDLRKFIGMCVNDDRVQAFILALIVINAIMMGVATFPFVKENPSVSSKFDIVDQIFLIIFTIEAAMQLAYHGWTFLKDPWLVFDVTIVALSWALEGVKVARAFRIFRALRLIARIGVMKNLIIAVVSVIPNLTAIIMLLCLVFYIFAVMFTQLYKDASKQYPRTQQYFVGLPETFFTLFQMMTLDGWRKIFLQAYEEYWWSWILFVIFVAVSAIVFVNLTIAVICDAVHVLGDDKVAGLTGLDVDEISRQRSKSRETISRGPSVQERLRRLQNSIDEVVLVQSELIKAIDAFARSR